MFSSPTGPADARFSCLEAQNGGGGKVNQKCLPLFPRTKMCLGFFRAERVNSLAVHASVVCSNSRSRGAPPHGAAAPRVSRILCVDSWHGARLRARGHRLQRLILGLRRGGPAPLPSPGATGWVQTGARLVAACLCLFTCFPPAVSTSPHVS